MGRVPRPEIRWRGAHPNNFTVGRPGGGLDGRKSDHHVVGSRESAVIVFNQPTRGASSHFVVGADIIDQCVDIANTAWCDGNWESNIRTIAIEHEGGQNGTGPYSDGMYERAAHLCAWLRENYGVNRFVRHRDVSQRSTACPGGLDCERIWNRATQIIQQYNQPVTPPAPEWQRNRSPITQKTVFVKNDGMFLFNLNNLQPADTRRFTRNQDFAVTGMTMVNGRRFYISKSSMELNVSNGIDVDLVADSPYVPPVPQPIPTTPAPTTPDWADSLLVDEENRTLFVIRATPLIDLENGHPVMRDGKEVWYQAGDIIENVSAVTIVANVTYQLTEYSFQQTKQGMWKNANGIKAGDLSTSPRSTPPGTPANPEPVPEPKDPVRPMPDVPVQPEEPVKPKPGQIDYEQPNQEVPTMGLSAINKAIAGALAGFIVMLLAKYNLVISDNLPNVIEALLGALVAGVTVYFAPKNKER